MRGYLGNGILCSYGADDGSARPNTDSIKTFLMKCHAQKTVLKVSMCRRVTEQEMGGWRLRKWCYIHNIV